MDNNYIKKVYEKRKEILKQLEGTGADEVQTIVIDMDTVFTSKPTRFSPYVCRYIEIPDIDTLKLVTGTPDSEYESAEGITYEDPHIEKLDSPATVCKALRTYVYGYSKFVEQHKKALQRLSFPRKIACFGGEYTELIVKANQTLRIREDDDKPVCCHFKKVTVESGGQILFEGHVDFETKCLVQEGSAKIEGLFLSRGSDGGNGGNDGKAGNGSDVSVTIPKGFSKCITMTDVVSRGGKGGNGGDGGKAGNPYSDGSSGASGKPGTPGRAGNAGATGKVGKINIIETKD